MTTRASPRTATRRDAAKGHHSLLSWARWRRAAEANRLAASTRTDPASIRTAITFPRWQLQAQRARKGPAWMVAPARPELAYERDQDGEQVGPRDQPEDQGQQAGERSRQGQARRL